MATPSGPISSPPPAAPAAPSAPAASSTPSAPAGGAGATITPGGGPAAPAAPAAGGGAAVAAPAGPAGPAAEPKSSEFPNTHEGQMQFMAARKEFLQKQRAAAGAQPGQPGPAEPKPAQAGAEQPKPAAEAQPGEPAPGQQQEGQQPPAAEAAGLETPKQLADLMNETPELKALFEAKPEVKGKIFGMARQLAALQPIGELFPGGVSDARFASENAGALITLKTQAMRAVDNPDALPSLLDTFDGQFAFVDDKGQPVLDAQGKPTYAPDREVFVNGLVNREMTSMRTRFQGDIEAIKQKLSTQAYPNAAARAMDEKKIEDFDYALTALSVIDQLRSGEFFQSAPPALPADATPEMKAWFEQQQSDLKRQKDELENTKRGASREDRRAAAQKFTGEIRGQYATNVGQMVGEAIKAATDAGVYIPEFYLQQKYVDPKTGQETQTADIAARLFLQFENELNRPGSRTALTIAEHELLPPSEQTKALRSEWYRARAAEIVPRLVQNEIQRINKLVKVDQDKMGQQLAARTQTVLPEPVTGGSSLPQGASEAQMLKQAEDLAKKDPGFDGASPTDKQARIVTQLHRLRRPQGR